MRREYDQNTPGVQKFVFARNGGGQMIDRQVRCNRQIQAGNVFVRRLRIAVQSGT